MKLGVAKDGPYFCGEFGKQTDEEISGESKKNKKNKLPHCSVNNPRVKINVRIELSIYEVFVT